MEIIQIPTESEINDLVQKTVKEYKDEVLYRLSLKYQSNQKIPHDRVISILNEVYESDIEPYCFCVEE